MRLTPRWAVMAFSDHSGPFSLEELLGPGGRAVFVDCWDERPNLWTDLDQARIDRLRAAVDLEQLIASAPSPPDGWVSLVDKQVHTIRADLLGPDGFPNLAAIASAYRGGQTVLLNQIHRRIGLIGALCRGVELGLGEEGILLAGRVGANLYATPPDSQGLDLHYDDHHVLVLQLQGTKQWFVHEAYEVAPANRQDAPLDPVRAGSPTLSATLDPGDVLYVPAGFAHRARTCGKHSVHLTLSLHPVTWLHLAEMVLKSYTPARRALRPKVEDKLRAGTRETPFAVLVDPKRLIGGIDRLRDRFVDGLHTLPEPGLLHGQDVPRLSLTSEIAVRGGVLSRHVVEGEWLCLRAPGVTLRCSTQAAQAITHIFERRRFIVADLPGPLSEADKLHLVGTLIERGLLRVVAGEPGR